PTRELDPRVDLRRQLLGRIEESEVGGGREHVEDHDNTGVGAHPGLNTGAAYHLEADLDRARGVAGARLDPRVETTDGEHVDGVRCGRDEFGHARGIHARGVDVTLSRGEQPALFGVPHRVEADRVVRLDLLQSLPDLV